MFRVVGPSSGGLTEGKQKSAQHRGMLNATESPYQESPNAK